MSAGSEVLPTVSVSHNWLTIASIGIVACVLADMVHEALGHAVAAWLTGDRILSISTVAIQNATANRFVSAAGTSANFIVGVFALLLLRSAKKMTSSAYFLWIFGAFNLLNSGYLIFSAVMNGGDWAVVVAGLSPPYVWRCILGFFGTILYVFSIRWMASSMIRLVGSSGISLSDMRRLVWPAYIAAGSVMTIASIFNPISPTLILVSGIGASFGLNSGLLFLPPIVAGRAGTRTEATRSLPFSFPWVALALVFAGIFVIVLGHGIHFNG